MSWLCRLSSSCLDVGDFCFIGDGHEFPYLLPFLCFSTVPLRIYLQEKDNMNDTRVRSFSNSHFRKAWRRATRSRRDYLAQPQSAKEVHQNTEAIRKLEELRGAIGAIGSIGDQDRHYVVGRELWWANSFSAGVLVFSTGVLVFSAGVLFCCVFSALVLLCIFSINIDYLAGPCFHKTTPLLHYCNGKPGLPSADKKRKMRERFHFSFSTKLYD